MIRAVLVSLALLAAPALAQDDHAGHPEHHQDHGDDAHDEHNHDEHVAQSDGLRAVHAWANATTGALALVYVELDNTSDADIALTGGEAAIAEAVHLVGLQNANGELSYAEIGQMPIAAGSQLVLSPNGLALQLSGLSQPLVEGETFEMEIAFGDTHLPTTVEIQSATATRHSHAGHQH